MSTSKQADDRERREVLENDRQVREQQVTTMHEFALSEANLDLGRYNAVGKQRMVGSTPMAATIYPAASAAHQVELPPEPPLGYSIDAMPDPTGVVFPPVATGPASATAQPSLRPEEQRSGAGLLSTAGESDDAA
jgi:hypothetical protein